MLGFLTIDEGAVFTVFGKITGDILAEVTGITVGLFAAVDKIYDIQEHTLLLSCTNTGFLTIICNHCHVHQTAMKLILCQLQMRFQGAGSTCR